MVRKTTVRRPMAQAPDDDSVEPRSEAAEVSQTVAPAAFIAALDVGYSNLKLLAAERGTGPAVTVLPAGAGPATAMPLDPRTAPSRGTRSGEDGLTVEVDGAAWAAGVERAGCKTGSGSCTPTIPPPPTTAPWCTLPCWWPDASGSTCWSPACR